MGSLIDGILSKLDKDTIIYLLSLLDTPRDLAHASCVCLSWRKYVIEGQLWKRMSFKYFPEFGNKYKCLSDSDFSEELAQGHLQGYNHYKSLELQSFMSRLLLQRRLSLPIQRTCIAEPLYASSTDNIPRESIAQTLYPEPEYLEDAHSYWSSKGEASTSVPEMLTYRLVSDLCVVYDVKVRPFQALFQHGSPIYSSQMVRFRFGYAQSTKPRWSGLFQCLKERPQKASMDDYVWTYVSPAFPMAQENTLQTFQLPKPTLCIGGILLIEFMGRVQTQSSDGLYYICICHVHVTGRPISDFGFEGIDKDGQFVLRHLSEKDKPSLANRKYCSLADALEKNDGLSIIEFLRINRTGLRGGSVVDMLLGYLLDAGLFNDLKKD